MSSGRPSIRVDGEIAPIDGEPVLTASEVESLLLDLAPERNREALRNGDGTEWMSDVPEVGRFRCQSFRDHRGPGGIFRMISTRPTSVDQLGLSREIQALCAETEGLVLVAGPRSSGKSTLIIRVRRSDQPDAQRLRDHDREPDRVRAREPRLPDQPARGARQRRGAGGGGPRRRFARTPTSWSSKTCVRRRSWRWRWRRWNRATW